MRQRKILVDVERVSAARELVFEEIGEVFEERAGLFNVRVKQKDVVSTCVSSRRYRQLNVAVVHRAT